MVLQVLKQQVQWEQLQNKNLKLILKKMESHTVLNGSFTSKGNYLWGGALTLAWKQLAKDIIKQPIKVRSQNNGILKLVENFNKSPFDFKMLHEDSYYARTGFGNETVNRINEQVHKKFPQKTTPKLQANLSPDSIISFAYFFKKLKFGSPFKKQQVSFNDKYVDGFVADTTAQKKQVLVHKYKDKQNFIIELAMKATNDHIFILKNQKQLKAQQVQQKVGGIKGSGAQMASADVFQMPKISISHRRSLEELKGIFLANKNFDKYFFSQVYEILKIDVDETGVKVENEGAIIMQKMAMIHKQYKRLILDKPFWIVMRQKENHPYFIAYISQLNDKNSQA